MTSIQATSSNVSRLKLEDIRRTWPTLSYHYGFSWRDIFEMPRWLRDLYFGEITQLLADEQMRSIEAMSYPYMKKGDQAKVHRQLARASRRGVAAAPAPKSEEQMRGLAAMHGIGMRLDEGGENVA